MICYRDVEYSYLNCFVNLVPSLGFFVFSLDWNTFVSERTYQNIPCEKFDFFSDKCTPWDGTFVQFIEIIAVKKMNL